MAPSTHSRLRSARKPPGLQIKQISENQGLEIYK